MGREIQIGRVSCDQGDSWRARQSSWTLSAGTAGPWQQQGYDRDGTVGHWQQQLAPGSSRDTIGDGTAGHWQQQGSVAFWTDAGRIDEATDHTFIPVAGTYVHMQNHGRCRVQEVKTRVCNTRLYRWVMSTPYHEICALKVWHVVRAYHRCTMLAIPSESIVETVGSVIADAADRGSGRPKDAFSSSP